ncbi:SIMPL domain-containing protein [Robertkochia solimangrovi]|uniref:SIMPL domain-containing protein n=1 Tax=Robertkochia solimangrovi TaxID=2213046 RepID=UPI00117EB1B1|nr:SIMPL domain-containing protein [Robertkochia solimangrovi]TRZ45300.1 SIMPL domain-containing protein [Robertkochia solimangrovi]
MMKKLVLLLTMVTAVPALAQKIEQPFISVTGEGVVSVTPDYVVLKLRVENEGNDLKEVKSANDKTIDGLIKYARKNSIEAKDVHTEYLNLNKNFNYQTKQYSYVANQSVSVVIRDMSRYSALVQGFLETGVNRIDGINFKSSKMEEITREARLKAVSDAKAKAELYAEALGQKIGRAIQITEPLDGSSPILRSKAVAFDAEGSAMETIAVGEMQMDKKITVVFELL